MSKTGPHVIEQTGQAMFWVARASTVKQVNGSSALISAPAGALTQYRYYVAIEDLSRNGADVAAEALVQAGSADVVLLYDETAQTGETLRRHTQFLKEAAPVIHAAGKLLAGYGFSTSFPRLEDVAYLVAENWGGIDILVMNEYWGLKDVPMAQRFTPWNALHHRQVHEASVGHHPPVWIGECGRDLVRDGLPWENEGLVGAGYQVDGVSEDQMVEEYLYFEGLIQEDSYVVAASAFTEGPTQDWREKGFDCDPIAERLALALPFTAQKLYLAPLLATWVAAQAGAGSQGGISGQPTPEEESESNPGGDMPIDKELAQRAIDIAWGNMEKLKAGRVTKKRRLELANDTEAHLVTLKGELEKA